MGRIIEAFKQFFDGAGDPLSNGWLRFLESGTNNTDKNTYHDPVYQIPNENPLQLDGEGRCPDVFGQGDYRVISFINDPEEEDKPGEQVQMFDPVTAQISAVSSGGGGGTLEEWDPGETYDLDAVVSYNSRYYRSLIGSNTGNNPAIEEYAWERIDWLRFYNSTVTYTDGDLVYFEYNLYLSKQSLNIGHDPDVSPAWWRPVATGYHNIFIKTGNYEILPSEFDSIFILGTGAAGAAQFDLPSLDATADRFKVAIYNESAYDLTISALGTASVWIDSTGDLILEPGVFQEFIYSFDIDTWTPFNNSGQALGGQNLATTTKRIETAYVNVIDLVTATVTDLYATTLYIPTAGDIFLGDLNQVQISFNGSNDDLEISVPSGSNMNFIVNSQIYWRVFYDGTFYPGSTNPLPNLGSSAFRLAFGYFTNLSLPDSGVLYLGTGNDFRLWHTGTNSYLYNYTGALFIGTTSAAILSMVTNSVVALTFQTSGNAYFYGSIYINDAADRLNFGSASNMQIYHSGSHAYLDCAVGNIYFRTGAGPANALLIDSSHNVNFYGNTSLGTDELHYMGDANNADIGYTVANGLMLSTNGAYQITLNTNSTNRWVVDSTGMILPVANEAYNIGSATYRVNYAYAKYIYTDQIVAPSYLNLWTLGGVAGSGYHNRCIIKEIWSNGTGASDGKIRININGIDYTFSSG